MTTAVTAARRKDATVMPHWPQWLGRNRSVTAARFRAVQARYERVPVWAVCGWVALVCAVVAAGAHSMGFPVFWPVAVTGLAGLAGHAVLRWTRAVVTVVIVGVFWVFAPVVAALYGMASGRGDLGGLILSLWGVSALLGVLAHRTSRYSPALTLVAALTAVAAVGPWVTWLVPAGGVLWGYVAAAVVLLVAAGTFQPRAWWARLRHRGVPAPSRVGDRFDGQGWALTGALLAGWVRNREDWTLTPGGMSLPGHVLTGPGGLAVVVSARIPGVVDGQGRHGLSIGGTPLAPLFASAARAAHRIEDATGLTPGSALPVVVLHSSVMTSPVLTAGLVDVAGTPMGEVRVVAGEHVSDWLDGLDVVAGARLSRTVTRKVRRALKHARHAGTDGFGAGFSSTAVDRNGIPTAATPKATPRPLFSSTTVDVPVLVGQRVTLLTDQGMFSGVRACSIPSLNGDGIAVVDVCFESEWGRDDGDGGPNSFPFPIASVTPE